jgi:hypothetical protein
VAAAADDLCQMGAPDMLRSKLGALLVAAALSIGVAGPAFAQPPSSTGSVVINGVWVIWGQYPSRSACADVGYYLVNNTNYYYSNYSCRQRGSVWELWLYDTL